MLLHPPGPARRSRRGAALLLALAAASCTRGAPESPWSEARLARLTLRQQAAQLVVARAEPLPPPGPAADSALARLRRWVFTGGGVELAGGDARAAAALVDSLRHGARLPPLVVARAEGGLGPRLAGATELPPPSAFAGAGDAEGARAAAGVLAAEAKAMGVHLVLLPGPPLPGAGGETTPYAHPDAPEVLGAHLAELAGSGVLAGLTAFAAPPGSAARRQVGWDRAALEVAQLEPLRAAVRGGAAAVEPAPAALPTLTGDTAPLPFSAAGVQGMLRRDLGFPLVIADAGPGVGPGRDSLVAAMVDAVAAGADLVVGVEEPGAMVDSLLAAVAAGRLSAGRIRDAARRVFAAKERAGLGTPPDSVRPPLGSAAAAATAREGFASTLAALAPRRPPLAGCRRTVLVTDPRSDVAALHAELLRRFPGLLNLRARRVPRRGPLSRVPGFAGNAADCAIVAAFPGVALPLVERVVPAPADTARRDTAAARRDSAVLAPRRIVHVSFAPQGAEPPALAAAALVVRGVGAQAQHAAARALAGEIAPRVAEDGFAGPGAVWPPVRRLARAPAAQAGMSADSLAGIDRAVRAALDGGVFTAAVVAVGRHGRLVKLAGYGRTSGRPVDPDSTLFDIASLTKVVGTTAAVMALVEDGRMRLDAPVRRYVAEFRGEGKGNVTVRHLLTHTSGLPAGADLFGGTAGPDEALRRVYRSTLVAEPGERVLYSDFGMILLAEAVRRRAEEPVDRFLARRVYLPLGMESTLFDPPLAWIDRTVPTALRSERPYLLDAVVHDGNAFRLGGVAGHAGIFSTAPDLAVFAQALLNGGAYGGRRVWQPATVRQFTARQPGAGTRTLGWDTPAPRSSAGGWFSARSFGHTGYTGTSLWIDPERDLFVVLLTNRTYDRGTAAQILALRRTVANAAARAVTDAPVRPRPGTPEAAAEAARERARARARRPRRPTRPRPRRRAAAEYVLPCGYAPAPPCFMAA
ncbi:MAG TPA: serine hydrolase domain-containing protein [Longimicrobiaceae bacterium]|nr:serine hydrolase domain-containing protein [Longimicrobiaceae bacterium]